MFHRAWNPRVVCSHLGTNPQMVGTPPPSCGKRINSALPSELSVSLQSTCNFCSFNAIRCLFKSSAVWKDCWNKLISRSEICRKKTLPACAEHQNAPSNWRKEKSFTFCEQLNNSSDNWFLKKFLSTRFISMSLHERLKKNKSNVLWGKNEADEFSLWFWWWTPCTLALTTGPTTLRSDFRLQCLRPGGGEVIAVQLKQGDLAVAFLGSVMGFCEVRHRWSD